MVCISEAYRHNQVPGTNIKSRMYQTCYMELFQSDLTAFYSRTGTTGFKFYFSSQYPFGIELIIERQYKTRDSNRITMIVRIASIATKETVDAVIFKTGYHFSISTETEFLVAVTIRSTCHFFLQCTLGSITFCACFIGFPCP